MKRKKASLVRRSSRSENLRLFALRLFVFFVRVKSENLAQKTRFLRLLLFSLFAFCSLLCELAFGCLDLVLVW